MTGSKKTTTKQQTKGNFWTVKVIKELQVVISVIIAEINDLFKHKTPKQVFQKELGVDEDQQHFMLYMEFEDQAQLTKLNKIEAKYQIHIDKIFKRKYQDIVKEGVNVTDAYNCGELLEASDPFVPAQSSDSALLPRKRLRKSDQSRQEITAPRLPVKRPRKESGNPGFIDCEAEEYCEN